MPLLAALAVGGVVYLEVGVNQPRLAALSERYERGLSDERARSVEIETMLVDSRRRVRVLEEKLRATPSVTTPAARPEAPKSASVAPRPALAPRRPPRPCRGDPNDPLNPCL